MVLVVLWYIWRKKHNVGCPKMDGEFATGVYFNETNKYHNLFQMFLGGPRGGFKFEKKSRFKFKDNVGS
jgi:hypothetical protein